MITTLLLAASLMEVPKMRIPDLQEAQEYQRANPMKWPRIKIEPKLSFEVCKKYKGREKTDCLLTLHSYNYIDSLKLDDEV